MVAEKINNSRSFGLFNDIRTDTPAHQLQCPGERNSTLLSVTSRGAVIDASGQAVQLRIGKRCRLPDVPVAASETSVILGEKLQEGHRRVIIDDSDPSLSRDLIKLRMLGRASQQFIFNSTCDHAIVPSYQLF